MILDVGNEAVIAGNLSANLRCACDHWKLFATRLFAILQPEMSRFTISRCMSGKSTPSLPALLRFEAISGIPLTALLTERITADQLPDRPIPPGDRLSGMYGAVRYAERRIRECLEGDVK